MGIEPPFFSPGSAYNKTAKNGSIPVDCLDCPARQDGLCAGVTASELSWVARHRRVVQYEQGDVIAHQGENVSGAFSVLSGVLILEAFLEDGRSQIVSVKMPGSLVALPSRRNVPFEIRSHTKTRLCIFERHEFELANRRVPSLGYNFLQASMADLDEGRKRLVLLGRKTAVERVATYLLMVAPQSKQGRQVRIRSPLCQSDTARFIGVTAETVNRSYMTLRRAGVVVFRKSGIFVPDMQRLIEASGESQDRDRIA